ncbi:malto-oligosyltrehalose trehalohydrolase [Alsobacter sp. KACC 23698]|uniref:Malto-oligosyltrehalose trehalohydrolase n=1 Tax=Alsobacter sp. KACC 23698 TaxID=3149229 RepID=A0AAU7JGV3_9HYPH
MFARDLPFGAACHDAGVTFRFWAPKVESVDLVIKGSAPVPMATGADGWREATVPGAGAGLRYAYRLPDGREVPDPVSRFQPDDVHGRSEVIDPRRFAWAHPDWKGRPWEECVIYELHVGAFTPEGTFQAVRGKLDHLASLGVTAIQLMPIADFPGRRNWGYDGVLPFAPDSAYGRPEDLKALIDDAHGRGLMVFLDVVYNHFGPDGNYLPLYAPVFTDRHRTPWGGGVDFDGPQSRPVRDLVIENALYWLQEYRFDGLRLDAVHAIMDDSGNHLLRELAERVHAETRGRSVHLILENEENEPELLLRGEDERPLLYTAQWNDDVHHVLHTAVTGEAAGYYADYAGDAARLARAIAEGFAFQGEVMPYRGSARGGSTAQLPPTAFVSFIQNHDQVGNRAFGDRITASARAEAVRAAAAVSLLSPQIPMLFMGEEWASESPFPFFCEFGPELAEAVRTGRRAEFARFPEFQDEAARERIPDPTAEATFLSAKLDWDALREPAHAAWRDWYARILAVRRSAVVPRLATIRRGGTARRLGAAALSVRWDFQGGGGLTLLANLSDARVAALGAPLCEPIWTEGEVSVDALGPWSVGWWVEAG